MIKQFHLSIDDITHLISSFLSDEDVFWIRDKTAKEQIYVSPSYENVWGRSCTSLYESPIAWNETILEEDRTRIIKELDSRYSSEKAVVESSILNFRIFRPDNSIRWIQDRSFTLFSADNQRIAFMGVGRSVPEATWQQGVSFSHVNENIAKLLGRLMQESKTTVNSNSLINTEKAIFVDNLLAELTQREKECLEQLLLGKTAKEACRALGISHRTVEIYTDNIKSKLKCKSKLELISRFSNVNGFDVDRPSCTYVSHIRDANTPEK